MFFCKAPCLRLNNRKCRFLYIYFCLRYYNTILIMNTSAWSAGPWRFSLAELLRIHEQRGTGRRHWRHIKTLRQAKRNVTLEMPLLQSTWVYVKIRFFHDMWVNTWKNLTRTDTTFNFFMNALSNISCANFLTRTERNNTLDALYYNFTSL